MIYLYLSITALVIFLIYVITCLCLFGVTHSLSETYYKFEEIKKNLGKFLFYTMLITVGLLTVISTIDKAGVFSWLMVVGISLVGVFPDYNAGKTQMDSLFHPIGAAIAAIASVITLFILLPWWLALIVFAVIIAIVLIFALSTKTLKTCYIYHLEMIAFYSLFGGAILYNLFFR